MPLWTTIRQLLETPTIPSASSAGSASSATWEAWEAWAGLGGLPVVGDVMRMLQGTPLGGARQGREIARTVATGGESEDNIDPADRIAIEQLVRVAELRVADATGLEPSRGSSLRVEVVNRMQWSDRTYADYGELFDALAQSVGACGESPAEETGQPSMEEMLAGITRMIGPLMLALGTGALVAASPSRLWAAMCCPSPDPPDRPF